MSHYYYKKTAHKHTHAHTHQRNYLVVSDYNMLDNEIYLYIYN